MIVEHNYDNLPPMQYTGPTGSAPEVTNFDSFFSGFLRESPVVAGYHLMTQADTPADPNFNFEEAARKSQFYADSPFLFNHAKSQAEFDQIEMKITRDRQLVQKEQANGVAGFLGALGGGILSPDAFLPGGAIFKGGKMASILKSAVSVGAMAALQTSLQETVLRADQPDRTDMESGLNVLGALALGGIIGGAAGSLTRKEASALAVDMASKLDQEAISTPPLQALSAAPVPEEILKEAGLGSVAGIDKALGVDKVFARLSPNARVISQQDSATARAVMANLDRGGLALREGDNIAGDIVSARKQWNMLLYDALNERNKIMAKYPDVAKIGTRAFSEMTTQALRRGANSGNVAADEFAKYLRTNLYGRFLNEAKSLGMKEFQGLDEEFVANYANRIVREGLVSKDYDEFIGVLQEHFSEQLTADWSKRMNTMETQKANDLAAAEDIGLSNDQVLSLRTQLEAEMKALPEKFPPEVQAVAEEIRSLRADARNLKTDEAKAMRAKAKALELQHKDALAGFTKIESGLKQRFSRLGRTRAGLEAKQRISLRQIERLEDMMVRTRQALIRELNQVKDEIDRWSPEKVRDEAARLRAKGEKVFDQLAKAEERIMKMEDLPPEFRHLEASDTRSSEKISLAKEKLEAKKQEFEAALDDVEFFETVDTAKIKQGLDRAAEIMVETLEETNFKRTRRIEAINERIKKNDPANAALEAAQYRSRAHDRQQRFYERMANANIKLVDGKLDVSQGAKELGEYIAQKYMGMKHNQPFLDILRERGPEIARYLHIDETKTWSNGRKFEDFLENDVEYLIRAYTRAMAPDIEMTRIFGTVNPMTPDSPFRKQIVDEFNAMRDKARAELKDKKLDKELQRISKAQTDTFRDLEAVVDRIRGNRGVPTDPSALGYRLGKIARNLNVVRMMGRMTLSSVTDAAAVVAKHGLTSTFRDGFVPLISTFKETKILREEAKRAGVALDMVLHSRTQALNDIMDEVRGGTMAERGLQWGANHMGYVTGMDMWNAGMKQFAGMITITRMSSILENLATGKAVSTRDQRFLSNIGIGEDYARMIYEQFAQSGDRVNGILMPNTEDWGREALVKGDKAGYARALEARRIFRTAVARSVDDTINTPGTELPLMFDSGETARVFFQFKSFTFSSTQKLLLAGAQELRTGDMAPAIGGMFSLALGALSYYLYAVATGGEKYKEMQDASLKEWAIEAVTRSYLPGVLGEVGRVGENMGGPIADLVTLGEGKTSRSSFSGPWRTVAGPTFGSLVQDLNNVITGAVSKDGMTEGDKKALRRLMPFNNLIVISRAFDAVEKYFK